MSDELITIDDVPADEIALVRAHGGRHLNSREVYDALRFISQRSPGRATRIITHGLSPHFATYLRSACRTRWPGSQVSRRGHIIHVILPQNEDAV